MPHTQKIKQDQELKFSQLNVRTIIFLGVFVICLLLFAKVFGLPNYKLFVSNVDIGITWLYSFFILLFIWFVYLIFIVKDNTIEKMVKVFKLYGSFSTPQDIGVRYVCLCVIMIINLCFSKPGLYSNINAIYHSTIFDGKATLKEKPLIKISNDKRFLRVYVEADNSTYNFQGITNEMMPLIDKKVDIKIYRGIFSKYALIEGSVQ